MFVVTVGSVQSSNIHRQPKRRAGVVRDGGDESFSSFQLQSDLKSGRHCEF